MSSNEKMISFPRELSDELAELIATKARVCGGGADEIWEAICEGFGKSYEQPHGEPVALPERKVVTVGLLSESNSRNKGWNACLDEIAKLGPLYTRPVQGEPVYQLRNTVMGNVWRDADKESYDSAASMAEYERRVVYTHADPGEAEQLRAELAVTKKLYAEASQASYDFGGMQMQIDTLHTQLAETHKLLKWFASCADVRQVGTVAMQKAAALSTSAEPSAPKCKTCHDQGEVFVRKGDVHYGMQTEPEPIMAACPDCAEPSAPVELDERDDLRTHLECMIGQAEFMLEMAENSFDGDADEDDGDFDECRDYIEQARAALERKP